MWCVVTMYSCLRTQMFNMVSVYTLKDTHVQCSQCVHVRTRTYNMVVIPNIALSPQEPHSLATPWMCKQTQRNTKAAPRSPVGGARLAEGTYLVSRPPWNADTRQPCLALLALGTLLPGHTGHALRARDPGHPLLSRRSCKHSGAPQRGSDLGWLQSKDSK